jgi:hypothetical protein
VTEALYSDHDLIKAERDWRIDSARPRNVWES